jgi:hypothetical protein
MRHKGMTQNPQGVWMAARKLNQQEITRGGQS